MERLESARWRAFGEKHGLSNHSSEKKRRAKVREGLGAGVTCCCSEGTLTSHGKNRRSCTSGSHSERSHPMSCKVTTQHTGRGICHSFERQVLVQKRKKMFPARNMEPWWSLSPQISVSTQRQLSDIDEVLVFGEIGRVSFCRTLRPGAPSTQTRHSKTTTESAFAGTNPMRNRLRDPQL